MSTLKAPWTLAEGARPLLWSGTLLFSCLLAVSFSTATFNRWIVFFSFVVPAAYNAFQTSDNLSPDDTLNDIYLRFVIILSSHVTYLCFNPSKNQLSSKNEGFWISGYKMLFNARGVGTSWELPHLWRAKQPRSTSKGKWTGISIRCGYLLLRFVVICCYYTFMDPEFLGMDGADFAPEKESIIRRLVQQYLPIGSPSKSSVTQREVLLRVYHAANNYMPDFLLLSAYHDFFSILFMAVGLDKFWEWPPLFGEFSQAYTMRRFWTLFWHRLIYRSFNSHATFISRCLGISPNSKNFFSRFFKNYLVFLLSGIMHGAVSWKFGTPCAWKASLQYWLLQPAAFVLEGVVQAFWGKLKRSGLFRKWFEGMRPEVLEGFEKTVGYTWVLAWLLWESPKRTFAIRHCKNV